MTHAAPPDPESARLADDAARKANWKRWGPYLAERQWGTVREDYSPDGSCWTYFPHDHARSRAYRWGEDGLLGFTDRECRLCFAFALWNGRDPILKERLFGLTNPEGNHGEDVKEAYYYLDSTPTHSYFRGLYKYPQAEFPYARLVEENRRRDRTQPEFELADTGVFDEGRYFDVFASYAKAGPDDLLILIEAFNRGPDAATLHLLPTLWFRNSWTWGCTHEGCEVKPRLWASGDAAVEADHATLGRFRLAAGGGPEGRVPRLIFTENETHAERLFGSPSASPYVKDAFHRWLIGGEAGAVNPRRTGTKMAAVYELRLPPGGSAAVRLRLTGVATSVATPTRAPGAPVPPPAADADPLGQDFDATFAARRREADAFYARRGVDALPPVERGVVRQAFAGLLWSKQFYHFSVRDWLDGDPALPPPPASRKAEGARNADWRHLFNRDVISMPDKWEYPWYAAWDLAFHMLPFAQVDPDFAKAQLDLLLREWYMHPSGQIPAYEFAFGDVNPPVHAWACWRVYKMTGPRGKRDRAFLARVFLKLMLNFTWWVNRKDPSGRHVFAGGFLGMDNIGVFDRSHPGEGFGALEQADGTAWMAFFCATMLAMALELAAEAPEYEDIASKFFEHFVAIVDAMNTLGGTGLWNDADGFYYDQLMVDGRPRPLPIRSVVGIIPLFTVEVLESECIGKLPGFRKRMQWFLDHRRDLARHIAYMQAGANGDRHFLLAVPSRERLERMLRYVLDESEFLSPFGIRSLSRVHLDHPFSLKLGESESFVRYEPAESREGMFGGNSNWRGPIWFPINYLLIEALERYHFFYGDGFQVECPTGSGKTMNLKEVSRELAGRLARLFVPGPGGERACHGRAPRNPYADDPHWKDLVLFHEYFDGDTGRGLGASHQTGWTALITRLLLKDKPGGP